MKTTIEQPIILTANEVKLILALRSLHPFEKITISSDKLGKVDSYIVERSFKEVWITSTSA
jgi:hypothetical protein